MVTQGIVLGHIISSKGIEVDKAIVDLISNLPHPKSVKEVRSLLEHAGFYRRFIKDFSKILNSYAIYLLRMHILSLMNLVLMPSQSLRNC